MILADTSVVIDILRSRDSGLLDIAIDQQAVICGITRTEVLHGARDANHRAKLLHTLDLFLMVPMDCGTKSEMFSRRSEQRA